MYGQPPHFCPTGGGGGFGALPPPQQHHVHPNFNLFPDPNLFFVPQNPTMMPQFNPFLQNPNVFHQQFPITNIPFQPNSEYSNIPAHWPNEHYDTKFAQNLQNEMAEKVDEAARNAWKDLVNSNQSVSAWKVSREALLAVNAESWESLGFQMKQVPSLKSLADKEGKINAFIDCFVAARRITSLHDLEVAVCKSEGVKQFDDLELGPLVQHPLAVHYFSLNSNVTEVYSIGTEEIISFLCQFIDTHNEKDIQVDTFLDFICKEKSVSVRENLCVRVQDFRLYVDHINQAKHLEDSVVEHCYEKYRKESGERSKNGSLFSVHKETDDHFNTISQPQRPKYFSLKNTQFCGKHTRFTSSSSEDDDRDDNHDEKNVVSSCNLPLPSGVQPTSYSPGNVRCNMSNKHSSGKRRHEKKVKLDLDDNQDKKNIDSNSNLPLPNGRSERISSCPYPSVNEELRRLGLKSEVQSTPNTPGGVKCGMDKKHSHGKRRHEKKVKFDLDENQDKKKIDRNCNLPLTNGRSEHVSSCPYPSVDEEMRRLGLKSEVQSTSYVHGDLSCHMDHSIPEQDSIRDGEGKRKRGTLENEQNQRQSGCSGDLGSVAVPQFEIPDGGASCYPGYYDMDNKHSSRKRRYENMSSSTSLPHKLLKKCKYDLDVKFEGSGYESTSGHSLSTESFMTFITTWKKACRDNNADEIVTREAIPYGPENSSSISSLVNWILQYAQRYFLNAHPNKYSQLKKSCFENLRHLKIVVVAKLFYRYKIKNCDITSKKKHQCNCLLQENILYCCRGSDPLSIFLELSCLLFDGTRQLHFVNFLQSITTMAESGATQEQIEFFVLNDQKVPKLPAEESSWSLLSEDLSSSTKLITSSPCFPVNGLKTPESNKAKLQGVICAGNSSDHLKDKSSEFNNEMLVEAGVPDSQFHVPGNLKVASVDLVSPDSKNFNPSVCIGNDEVHLQQAFLTGRLGEHIAFKYFIERAGEPSVKWVNEVSETGLPYDIVVEDEQDYTEYVEVKATRFGRKNWFQISLREWQFAVEKGEYFSIAHVALTDDNVARITIYKNPARLCQLGNLKLALLVSKQ